MSFRKYGGLNFASKSNIVSSTYNSINNLSVSENIGQPNSFINLLRDLSDNVTIDGNLNIKKKIYVTDDIDCNGNLNISNDVDCDGNLNVSSDIDCNGNLNVFSDIDCYGNLNVSSNIDCSGNLNIKGNIDCSGNLYVTDDIDCYGNIVVADNIECYGNFYILDDIDCSGNLNLDGNLNIKQNLYVADNIDSSNLIVNEKIYCHNEIDCSGNLSTLSDLYVEKNSYLYGKTYIGVLDDSQTSLKVHGIMNTSKDAIINSVNIGQGNNSNVSNLSIGYQSGNSLNILSSQNAFLGNSSGYSCTSGNDNTFIGYLTGYDCTTGNDNTFIGSYSGYNSKNIQKNTFIGSNSGNNNVSGSYLTLLGCSTDINIDISSNDLKYSTAIGYGAKITGSNQIMLGGDNNGYPEVYAKGILSVGDLTTSDTTQSLKVNGSSFISGNIDCLGSIHSSQNINATRNITSGSDYRLKTNIKDLSLTDYTIDNLRPIYFQFKDSKEESIGLIAHEVQNEIPFLVQGEKDGDKTQTVNYMALVGLLVKEVQELKKELKVVKKALNNKKNKK